jgi:hypothetical protein
MSLRETLVGLDTMEMGIILLPLPNPEIQLLACDYTNWAIMTSYEIVDLVSDNRGQSLSSVLFNTAINFTLRS